MSGLVTDTYMNQGYRKRHPKCRCKAPCQRSYMCRHPKHRGSRSTPWCSGGTDSPHCDACWSRDRDKVVRAGIRAGLTKGPAQ